MNLIGYDAACRALTECKAVDEVKTWADTQLLAAVPEAEFESEVGEGGVTADSDTHP
jgi:hypothetical protein